MNVSSSTLAEDAALVCEPWALSPQPAALASGEFRGPGLTTAALSAHTEKEEQDYVDHFRERLLTSPYSCCLQRESRSESRRAAACSCARGASTSKQTRPAGCKKGKHRRRKLPTLLSGTSSGSSMCPRSWELLPGAQPCCPPVGPAAWATGLELPCTAMMPPSPAPHFLPLPVVTSLGAGATEVWGPAPASLPTPPWPSGLHTLPALPPPSLDTFMTILLQTHPICPPWSPSFSPHPPWGASGASEMPPVASRVAANLETPRSVESQRKEEDKWEACSEEPPNLNSRSSSLLQLNLLQEEMPGPWASPRPMRGDVCPEAEGHCVSENRGHSDLSMASIPRASLSGTGSAASGSGGSSGHFSSSAHSSELSGIERPRPDARQEGAHPPPVEGSIRRMIQQMPERVLLTYQVPARAKEVVLKEDLAKLESVRQQEPQFSPRQKEELAKMHL